MVHVNTLLNPFFEEEYVVNDDGQKFGVFTKINQTPASTKDKNDKKGDMASDIMSTKINETAE